MLGDDGFRSVGRGLLLRSLERRVTLLLTLLNEVRQRLGLRGFRPSAAPRVRVRIAQVDVLTLVPGTGSVANSIRGPGRARTVRSFRLEAGARRDSTLNSAHSMLMGARERFGTSAILPPLP